MNMTRAILERVAEVELQITPEFQKREDRDADTWVMHAAFEKNGWLLKKHGQSGDIVTYVYEHPSLPQAQISYSFSAHSAKVEPQMLVRVGKDAEPTWFDTEPDMVKKITDDWLKIQERVPEIQTIVHMLVDLSWVTLSDTVVFGGGEAKARVFAHPKVDKKIRVSYVSKSGDVIAALVLSHNESPLETINKAPASIHQKAQELMKEAGA